MEKFICEIDTLTPMFMEGADAKTPELRTQSIKGLLRFWWRAYKYGQLQGVCSIEDRLLELKKWEGKIFGSSDEKVG